MKPSSSLPRIKSPGGLTASAPGPASPLDGPGQGHGRVRVAGGGAFVIDTAAGPLRARRAASCLLQPDVGDLVAWCRGDGGSFVYAVLEKPEGAANHLSLDGDTRISVRGGELELHAEGALRGRAPQIEIEGEELRVRSTRTSLVTETLTGVARSCNATLGMVRMVGSQLSSVFDRVFQHAKNQHRVVEGSDLVDVQHADWKSRSLLSLRGKTVVTDGERLVKARGAQIHLG